MTNGAMLQCIVVTPERTFCDQPAEFVALTLFDGEIGIAPGHTPMIGRLGFGEMRIRRPARTDHYYVEGGFVEVLNDVVSILTQRVVPSAEIDEAVVREHLYSAQSRTATTPELMAIRDRVVEQSRGQLRVARRDS
jgi:F-type H+-transporting ATPase subunit epsilon